MVAVGATDNDQLPLPVPVTDAPELRFNVHAPEAVTAPLRAVLLPWQIVAAADVSVADGTGFTVIVTGADAVQPFGEVTVTVYVCVEDGLATTVLSEAVFKPEEGDHA